MLHLGRRYSWRKFLKACHFESTLRLVRCLFSTNHKFRMNFMCFRKFRQADCFCSRYDENRQTMFYCGFFTTLAGFIWFVVGFSLKCAFFTQAFGPSVTAVACGIMVVGCAVLLLGICFTLSIVCRGKGNNKTGCVSTSSGKFASSQGSKKNRIYFDSPLEIDSSHQSHGLPFASGSFSSAELNPSSSSISSTMSSSPTSSSAGSYKSDIAMIA